MSYKVELSPKVKETLSLAKIKYDKIRWMPIEKVKKACEINLKDSFKPIYVQYLWYCLDETKIKRKLKGGRIVKPKVIFNSVYLEPKNKFIKLLKKAMSKLLNSKRQNFAKLVDRSPQTLDTWKSGRGKIPLTAILKACQLMNLDIWEVINKEKIFASGKDKTNYIIFKNSQNIGEILVWIKAEGYLHISSTEINLVQNRKGINSLKYIVDKIEKSFNIPKSKIHVNPRSDKPNAIDVTISSAPLRQILVLKYNIPLGFKSYEIDYKKEIEQAKSKEEKLQLLAKIFESEGSFGFRRPTNQPDFHIVSASSIAVKNVANLLGDLNFTPYGPTPHHSAFKTGITNIEDSVKFCYDILPYFKHTEKIQYILFGNNRSTNGFNSEEYLQRLKKKKKIPRYWLLISWIHGNISRQTLERSRGLSFKHIEEVLNGTKAV